MPGRAGLYFSDAFSTISGFHVGRLIEEYRGGSLQDLFLLCSIWHQSFYPGIFKYADFLLQTVNTVFGTSIPFFGLPLPIGISFYTLPDHVLRDRCTGGIQKRSVTF